MGNNSTNISKRTITSYLKSLNIKKTTTYDVENAGCGCGLDRDKDVAGLNRLMGSQCRIGGLANIEHYTCNKNALPNWTKQELTRLTRRVSLVEQDLLTLPEHLSS